MQIPKKTTSSRYAAEVRRAALPEVLHTDDIALAMRVKPSAARKAILRGECGPYARLGRRLVVLRADFIEAIRGRQEAPLPRPGPAGPGAPPDWAKRLLKARKPGRGR